MYGTYADIEYFSGGPSIRIVQGGRIHLINATFNHHASGNRSIAHFSNGTVILDTCSWGDSDHNRCLYDNGEGTWIIIDCTMKAAQAWMEVTHWAKVYLLGTNTIDIGGGAVEPDNTNDTGAGIEQYMYYPKSTDNETNSLVNANLTLYHPSIDSDGMLVDSTTNMEYYSYFSYDQTDASGNILTYKLKKVMFDKAWKYWSDSGQAEAGDNQKWTGYLSKTGYAEGSDTEWAGTNMSFTLPIANQIVAHPTMFNQGMN
jgi:hypothetical protein